MSSFVIKSFNDNELAATIFIASDNVEYYQILTLKLDLLDCQIYLAKNQKLFLCCKEKAWKSWKIMEDETKAEEVIP